MASRNTQFQMLEQVAKCFADLRPADADQRSSVEETLNTSPQYVEEEWRKVNWLHHQLLEYKGTLNAAKDEHPPSSEDIGNLTLREAELRKELIEAETDSSLRDLILQRLQMSSTLTSTLFPEDGYDDETAEEEAVRRRVAELLLKKTEYGSAVLRITQEIEDITPELEEKKMKNLDLLQKNRKLMWNVEQAKLASNTTPRRKKSKLQKIQAALDQTLDEIELVRHVFQAIILGSGINWGADKELTELLVHLGTPVDPFPP